MPLPKSCGELSRSGMLLRMMSGNANGQLRAVTTAGMRSVPLPVRTSEFIPRLTDANGLIVSHAPPKPNRKVTVMLRRLISTSSTWITVPLRLALGVIFIGHGAQKVFGTFNGPGWAKWTAMSQAVPFPFMRPTSLWLGAAAVSELVGGVLILLGFLTRVGAFLIVCTMLTAIRLLWPAFLRPQELSFP